MAFCVRLMLGLTVAEYFRDVENQDVLLFIDNIFRFTQVRCLWPPRLFQVPRKPVVQGC